MEWAQVSLGALAVSGPSGAGLGAWTGHYSGRGFAREALKIHARAYLPTWRTWPGSVANGGVNSSRCSSRHKRLLTLYAAYVACAAC